MSRVKFVPLLVSLALSFLVGVSGAFAVSEPCFCQAGGAEADRDTIEARCVADSRFWRRPIQGTAKRRTDTLAPTVATLGLVTPTRDQVLSRLLRPSAAVVYQAASLYQSLQVYRL
jgi:hypothetical protein